MSKKYAILAAGLVASGRSLSTTSILEGGGREPNSVAQYADDWPFSRGSALAFDFEEQASDELAPPASPSGISWPDSPTL
jgi:hypothetical protein